MSISVQFKIIGEHQRKSGKFEYGAQHYTACTRNKNAFRQSEQWWFVIKTISSVNSKHLEWTKYPQTGHTIISICRTLYLMYILRLQVFLN